MITKAIERPACGLDLDALAKHLREHASDYYSQFGQAEARTQLLDKWERNNSHLYRFELNANGHQRRLYVKVPTVRGGRRSESRPYLIPETDPNIKFRLHYEALRAVHENFQRVNDPRFGSVRILDILPGSDAFVMDEVNGQIIRRLLTQSSRVRFGGCAVPLAQAFHNAGAWLRVYHAIPDVESEVVHGRRVDLVDNVRRFTDYLAGAVGDAPFFQGLADDVDELAGLVLPERLPLGLRFGDFGLTNVMVGPDARVTAIDTLARWRTPIYEDIAWFLTGLKAYNLQVFSQGLAFNRRHIANLQSEFLSGYFGHETVPANDIRLFEMLRLLERWSAKATRNQRRRRVGGRLSSALVNRFFRKTIRDLVRATKSTVSETVTR